MTNLRNSRVGFSPIILIIIAAVAGVGAVALMMTIVGVNPLLPTRSIEPTPTPSIATQSSRPKTTTPKTLPPVATPPASTLAPSSAPTLGLALSVVPSTSVSADLKTYYIKFLSSDFTKVSAVSYTFKYETDNAATPKAVTGTFNPSLVTADGYESGKSYIMRVIVLGVCSGGTCTYDPNPRNFQLFVTSTPTVSF